MATKRQGSGERKEGRLVPDLHGYGKAMTAFMDKLTVEHPRSPATTKIALTTAASRTFTKEFGVEFNILMTKLYGEERTFFGFDKTPEQRHFAVKIYGYVFEFGPYPDVVRKTPFLDWIAEHPDFEYATIIDRTYEQSKIIEFKRPVVSYTMKLAPDYDMNVDLFRRKLITMNYKYDPVNMNCFSFIKFALMILDPEVAPDSEMQRWMTAYAQTLSPNMRKTLHRIQRKMHHYAGYVGTGRKIGEVVLEDEDDNKDSNGSNSNSRSCDNNVGNRYKRRRLGIELTCNNSAVIDLTSDDEDSRHDK